ncbi:MAG: hypothetical protein D3916_03245 [Candidatus Electrothrix sp. MAN1_4]|nr:hypothetical protein [Candidatus Electrothrix sp. MAN1_4]
MQTNDLNQQINIAVVTLDSLRYDIAIEAHTPQLDAILNDIQAGSWRRVYSRGEFTLPSHFCAFHSGHLPSNNGPEPIYNHWEQAAFRVHLPWSESKNTLYKLPIAPNIVKGFELSGSKTVGVGGVGWFDTRSRTTSLWKEQFFQEFYWKEAYSELNPYGFEAQLNDIQALNLKRSSKRLFFFLNISSTHWPYGQQPIGLNWEGTAIMQRKRLEYIDRHLEKLCNSLPTPCHYFIFSDHGECFGEDGLFGHGFYHPKVHEVPMVHFILR